MNGYGFVSFFKANFTPFPLQTVLGYMLFTFVRVCEIVSLFRFSDNGVGLHCGPSVGERSNSILVWSHKGSFLLEYCYSHYIKYSYWSGAFAERVQIHFCTIARSSMCMGQHNQCMLYFIIGNNGFTISWFDSRK